MDCTEFKVIVDTLASAAAFIAIVGTTYSWIHSARKPLKVVRVVVHRGEDKSAFILVIRNVKAYPVQVKSVDCYRRKKYQVQRKRGGKPEYAELFPGDAQLFRCSPDWEVPANGHSDFRIEVEGAPEIPNKLLFLMNSSHGYQELWCANIKPVDIGKVEVYGLDYRDDYPSRVRAKGRYYWEWCLELTWRCIRRR